MGRHEPITKSASIWRIIIRRLTGNGRLNIYAGANIRPPRKSEKYAEKKVKK